MKEAPVMADIKKCLAKWHHSKVITWWSRLNCGKVKTEWGSYVALCEEGTPDFCVNYIDNDLELNVLWVEAKRGDGKGKTRDKQIEFMAKQSGIKNTHCLLVDNVETVNSFIHINGIDLTAQLPEELC